MVDIDNDRNEKLSERLKIPVSALKPDQYTDILPIDEALQICRDNDLCTAFYYYSFSHTANKPKYRLCFIADEPVTNRGRQELIGQTLVSLFRQADTSCTNADRIFYGTDKNCVICDLNAVITFENILKAYTMPVSPTFKLNSDDDLNRLKQEFDFFGYLQQSNGEICKNNSTYAMFKYCELCGHEKDLVYYHKTKTFMCFGAGCHRGGSIIDYLMIAQGLNVVDAIAYFKYELCHLPKESKLDYAIRKTSRLILH